MKSVCWRVGEIHEYAPECPHLLTPLRESPLYLRPKWPDVKLLHLGLEGDSVRLPCKPLARCLGLEAQADQRPWTPVKPTPVLE